MQGVQQFNTSHSPQKSWVEGTQTYATTRDAACMYIRFTRTFMYLFYFMRKSCRP